MTVGRAWLPIGSEILRQKLGLPDDTQIIGARSEGSGIELLIESPKLTDVIPRVDANWTTTKKAGSTVDTFTGFVAR